MAHPPRVTSLLSQTFRAFESIANFVFLLLNRLSSPYPHKRERARRVLLTRMDSVGDMLLFTASLTAYRELYRQDHLVLVARDEVAAVVAECPLVNEVWPIDARGFRTSLRERWRWCRRLHRAGFDIAVNTVFSNYFPEFDCLVGWTCAPRRIAHRCMDRFGERQRGWPHYTELAPSTHGAKFEVDRNHDMLTYLGYRGAVQRTTRVWAKEHNGAGSPAAKNGTGRSHAVVCPGARAKEKIWAPENFLAVLKIVNDSFPVHWIVCGDETEMDLCETLTRRLNAVQVSAENLAGRTSVLDLKSVIEGALVCLGNDSAPLHIAAAVGTPGVCVLGGGHFGRFYPYPDNPQTIAVFHTMPCYHCHWHCVLSERECLTLISIESVVHAVLQALKVPKRSPSGVADAIT